MNWWTTAKWTLASVVPEFLLGGKQTGLRHQEGAPFLIQDALAVWLALMRPASDAAGSRPAVPRLPVVQLLGNVDDQVLA
jgi:hypothetical protein